MELKPEIDREAAGSVYRDEEHGRIDRTAYEPAYSQLVHILKSQIASGRFRPGAQLPSEAQLCQLYQVSPMTVRRAVNILLDHGLVTTAQGRGTFVKGPDISQAVFQLQSLKDYMVRPGRVHVSLLEARVVPAPERVARKLSIEAQQWVVFIRRLLMEQGTPISYHREYLIYDPRRPIVEGELEVMWLEGLIRGNGQSLVRSGCMTIEAVTLREEEAQLLNVPPCSPAFLMEHVFRDFDDRAISWGWFVWRADHIKFTATIGPQPAVP